MEAIQYCNSKGGRLLEQIENIEFLKDYIQNGKYLNNFIIFFDNKIVIFIHFFSRNWY